MACRYILSFTLVNNLWSDIARCASFFHCRQEEQEMIEITILTPLPLSLFWCHLLLQLNLFSETVTNILPFTLNPPAWKQKPECHRLTFLFTYTYLATATVSIHCNMNAWLGSQILAIMYGTRAKQCGNVCELRSYDRKAKTSGYVQQTRENQFRKLPRCSWR